MNITLFKRGLNEDEVNQLVTEIRKFPNPLTGRKTWESLHKVYILYEKKHLVGVCGIVSIGKLIKIGPFVVFQNYQQRGYGKKLLEVIVKDYPTANLFVGSRSHAVMNLALHLGFKEEKNVFRLPFSVTIYILRNILENINIYFLKEYIRKHPAKEGPYRFFFKRVAN